MPINRLIVFTFSGEGASLVTHAIREGLDAELAIIQDMSEILTADQLAAGTKEPPAEKKRRLMIGEGLMPRTTGDDAARALEKIPAAERGRTFVFFDLNVCFRYAEMVKNLGFPGNYPTEADRVLEADREAGKAFVEAHYRDLDVAEHHEFSDVKEAIEFLEDTEESWVLKGYHMDAPTVVPDGDDPEKSRIQIVSALEKRSDVYEKEGFLLERKIPRVLELTPQGVWYDGRPVYYSLDIELKRKGAGDTGLAVGCAGNLVIPLFENDRLVKIAFPPAVTEMAKKRAGMFIWDASILVDPKTGDLFYGEFCPNRPGYDSLFTEIEMSGGVRRYFESIIAGKNPLAAQAGYAVRVFNDHRDPDEPKMAQPGLALGIDEEQSSHAWTMDARAGEEGMISNGYVADLVVITGAGPDPAAAIAAAYDHLEHAVSFEGAAYRPMHDVTASAYPGAIMNRYDYGRQHGLFGSERSLRMPYPGWKNKQIEQYKAIKETFLSKGRGERAAKQSAAKIVNSRKGKSIRKMVRHTRASE